MKFVIYIFLTYSLVVLYALKKCEKVNVCKCETDEGVIDLSSLAGAGSNIPRFKNIVDKLDEYENKISWNPCNKWTEIPPSQSQAKSNCDNIAVCYNFKNLEYFGIGKQETADYSYNETSGTCVLTLTGKPFQGQGPQSTSTHIFLQCDTHEEGRVESLERTLSTTDDFKVFMKLHTKYACVKSGLSVGSIIIIIFISLLLVYLVAGILFNKYSKGASGKELFPNVNFWIDFPLLVKDGAVFSFECCKKICSRKRSCYESI